MSSGLLCLSFRFTAIIGWQTVLIENLPEKSGGDASHSARHDEALHIFTMRYNGYASLCGIIGKSDSL